MNLKKDIIDAWIAIEQFSEGDIKPSDINYKYIELDKIPRIDSRDDKKLKENLDWKKYFLNKIEDFIRIKNISVNNQGKVGLVLYFGIFDFDEVIKIIRNIYKIEDTGEELKNVKKFTLSLYFDKDLNFIPEKLFLTMSGFVKKSGKIPNNLLEIENDIRERLTKDFQDKGFNCTLDTLNYRYKINDKNFRMSIYKNIELSSVDMHSFFIEDLKKAKHINNSPNLERYLNGFNKQRINLDSNSKSLKFNYKIFYEILQPKNYPMGRFPSNSQHKLSFMQQVAVNLYLNDSNNLLSVNGPPGTGKTTLLKDIFADLIVKQSYSIIEYIKKPLKAEYRYNKDYKIAQLPKKITQNSIVVASSNNGAVQNIVKDLPQKKEIDTHLIDKLSKVDYFTNTSNSYIEKNYNSDTKRYEIISYPNSQDNWGMFSIEGGAFSNMTTLLNKIDSILIELQVWEPSELDERKIIDNFINLYEEVSSYKEKMQKIYLESQKLNEINKEIEIAKEDIKLKDIKRKELNDKIKQLDEKIFGLKEKKKYFQKELLEIKEKSDYNEKELERAKRNFDVIFKQMPKETLVSKIKSLFIKTYNSQYNEKLEKANRELNHFESEYKTFKNRISEIKKRIKGYEEEISNCNEKKKNLNKEFSKWFSKKNKIIKEGEKIIYNFNMKLKEENIKLIDFGLTYDDLQKSNPWSNRKFRVLQSELFISSLEVRKLFLLKNRAYLKASQIIFSKQSEFISKENGRKLIQIAWEWINMAIPIVSSTFASFSRMFKFFDENSIGSLFIDEAGQALPQSCIGSIFRSKKVMAVGDPSQIKPVLTLDSNMMNIIAQKYDVDERFVSNSASAQSLIDSASQYGFEKGEKEWIGIPLWVHRRSNFPMFSISNKISYQNLMVQGKIGDDVYGKAFWYDVKGNAIDKYVKEQGEKVKELIQEKIDQFPELKNDIYVITPFRNVANKLIEILKTINFVIFDQKNKAINVGTVHTFQGKEAKVVYFVLGGDKNSKGAARWAFSEPNILNVAVTRSKDEFYIVGDKKLYESLGSNIITNTIKIIDEYNMK